jgi:zinc-binding alcohol dehydrogenase/oxidoreductase
VKGIILNRALNENIELTEVNLGELGENEVRVKLMAASLNHRDEWCRQGLYPGLRGGVILGSDGAGIVEEVGSGVESSWIGKEVIINPGIEWGESEKVQSKTYQILGMPENGTLAEYVHVPKKNIHPKPSHLSWEEAAALPLGGLTAFRAVIVKGSLQPLENVLVTGFGGGVAQFAAQMAIQKGANVYVSSSMPYKIHRAKKLGAKGGFIYDESTWTEEALQATGGFDLIIDSAMGDTLNDLLKVTKPGGRIVLYGATKGNPTALDARKVFWNQIEIKGSTMGSDEDFNQMLAWVNTHQLVPIIDQVFQLENYLEAFDRIKMGKQLGKIVFKISND